jgi:ABC-2 type transport system ATP-binding protein
MTAIVVESLSKSFRTHKRRSGLRQAFLALFRREHQTVRAVDSVSFRIEPGEFVGFLGPNGAGKTTTLKMLAGLVTPDSGTATVLGHVPWRREDAYRRRFSLVMGQKNQLWWDLPAGDSFLLNKEIYGVADAAYKRTLDELLGLLGVADKVGVPVRDLSLGERMKMELTAALLHSPQVLFLDEPTIGLDVTAQANIRDCLRRYNRDHGVTVLLTSHYMKDIQALCPRVIVINHGRIVHDGKLSGVLETFGRHKLIKARFAEGAAPPDLSAAGGRLVGGQDPQRIWEVPRERVTAFTQELLSRPGVDDLAIEDPPLEDIIAEVFRGPSDAAAAVSPPPG